MAKDQVDVTHWETEAENWIRWARTPGHDAFWAYRDGFATFVGKGSESALDLGCGEGRVSRLLGELGYRVTACDPVDAFVSAARDLNSAGDYAVAGGTDLPFANNKFGLVIAYNVLMDVENIATVVGEAHRVLEPGGTFIISIVHPFADIGRFEEHDGQTRYIASTDYFGRKRFEGRDTSNGLTMNFAGWSQPLRDYTAALTEAGFAITRLEEPLPAATEDPDHFANWRKLPLFLWLKARKLESGQ